MNTRVPHKPTSYFDDGFADRLIEARCDLGLTQEELSAMTIPEGSEIPLVPVRTLSNWERGMPPHLGPGIRAIAKALDQPLAWLRRGDESGRRADHRSDDPRSRA
jgi:transcriptional regulator with XRE-family HTH domain